MKAEAETETVVSPARANLIAILGYDPDLPYVDRHIQDAKEKGDLLTVSQPVEEVLGIQGFRPPVGVIITYGKVGGGGRRWSS